MYSFGRHSVVGVVTRYGLYGPGIESRRGEISAPVQTRGPTSPLYSGYQVIPGVKRPGRSVNRPPPPLAQRLKKKKSYTCTPSLCLHGRGYRVNFTLLYFSAV